MSDMFDPGKGRRKEPYRDDLANDFVKYIYYFDGEAGIAVTWVPGKPVPSLPTVPYTVIRVTWSTSAGAYSPPVLVLIDGLWSGAEPADVQWKITGFEVLSEPRAITAKAVLDRVLRDGWESSPSVWAAFDVEHSEVEI